MSTVKERLEELRTVLRNECISYGELAELQSLAGAIDPDDVELLEPAGVSEDRVRLWGISEYGTMTVRRPFYVSQEELDNLTNELWHEWWNANTGVSAELEALGFKVEVGDEVEYWLEDENGNEIGEPDE